MSLRERVGALFARRVPPETPSRPIAWLPVRRGNIVVTQEKALQLATCFACARAISEDIAKLPWNAFSRSGNKRTKLDNSPLHRLLNVRPNPDMGSFSFRETLVFQALTWGNAYAEIERDISGRPTALWPIYADRVTPKHVNGRLIYEVRQQSGDPLIIQADEMFHLHGVGFDGVQGYSMVGLAAQSLGFAIAAEEHGASFYGNNTTPGLALKTDAVLNEEGFERLKKQIAERKGSARAYEGMILEQGMDFARPNMSQVDAQYVETRRQQVEEICRWWRVPPHKVGELSRAHFTNIEHQNIDYVTDTLMPWVKRLEEEADWKLIGNRSQASYTKIAVQALMRGDSQGRATFYKELRLLGALSANDIRALEDLDPIPDGDGYYMQSQYVPLKAINDGIATPKPEAPKPDPEKLVETVSNRLFDAQLKKARAVYRHMNRESYEAWVDNQAINTLPRVEKLFADLHPVLPDLDVYAVTNAYLVAEREQLMLLFDGQEPDSGRVSSLLLEVIK